MNIELLTKNDLQNLKTEIISELMQILSKQTTATWVKSTDVRKNLSISAGTLQTLRINGVIPYTKVGGSIYYKLQDIENILESNKRNLN